MRVRAIAEGYYQHVRRRVGDVFDLIGYDITVVDPKTARPVAENGKIKTRFVTSEELFSVNWMERVDDNEPEKVTASPAALAQAQSELNEGRRPARRG